MVKNNNVLLKFFKKINSIYSRNINKNENLLSFDTFSQLQRNSTDINSFDDISNIWKFNFF